MEQTLIQEMWAGIMEFLHLLDWPYVVTFIILAWIINDMTDAKNTTSWLNWYQKVPKLARTIILGLILVGLFGYFLRYNVRELYFELFLSMVFSLVIYKIGIDKVLDWLGVKIFNFKK